MTLSDFFRYLATDERTSGLSAELADAFRLQAVPVPKPAPHPVGSR